MKYGLVLVTSIVCIFGCTCLANGEGRISPSLGFFNPDGQPEAGILAGVALEGKIDRNVWFSGEIDVYHKSYAEEEIVAEYIDEFGNLVTSVVRPIDTTSTLLPITGNIKVNFTEHRLWSPYFTGGLGYQILFNHVENYYDGISRTRTYGGFTYRLGVGFDHILSPRTNMFVEGFYQVSEVSRETGDYYIGLPIREEIDFDGIAFRVGLRFGPHDRFGRRFGRPPRPPRPPRR